MAYVKKADRIENFDEINKEKAVDFSNNEKIEALEKQNAELSAKIDALMAMFASGKMQTFSEKNEEITIIHLIQCYDGLKTHIKLSNRSMDFSVIGETRVLNRTEAEEIASKYRKFFERGVIAFSSDNIEFARKFDLASCVSDGKVNRDFANYIGEIDIASLEKLYNSVGEAQKAFIIETFKRKIREGNPKYNNMAKIQLLERLTLAPGELNGAMEGVFRDLEAKNKK